MEFDVEKHRQCDSGRPWLPVIVLHYLSSNYPAVVIEEILSQLVDVDRGRSVVLCHSCEPFVRNDKLQVSAHDEKEARTRLCDYAVDPVVAIPGNVWERWQEHTGSMEDGNMGDPPSSCYILGRSVQQFAPAVAALSDGEEMVNPWHKPSYIYTLIRILGLIGTNTRQRNGDYVLRTHFLSLRFKYRCCVAHHG